MAKQEQAAQAGRARVTWLGLGEEWGVVRDVRRMIYGMLTPLERVTVEKAHGMDGGLMRYKKKVCRWSAERGHLEVLKWARANGCPWNEVTCSFAAKERHLEVLQWAVANGCPWG